METNKLDHSMKELLSVLEVIETKQRNEDYEEFQTVLCLVNRKKKKVTAAVSEDREDSKGLLSLLLSTNRLPFQ